MDFLVLLEKLAPLALAVLPHLARAIIDGLSAAGVTHDREDGAPPDQQRRGPRRRRPVRAVFLGAVLLAGCGLENEAPPPGFREGGGGCWRSGPMLGARQTSPNASGLTAIASEAADRTVRLVAVDAAGLRVSGPTEGGLEPEFLLPGLDDPPDEQGEVLGELVDRFAMGAEGDDPAVAPGRDRQVLEEPDIEALYEHGLGQTGMLSSHCDLPW